MSTTARQDLVARPPIHTPSFESLRPNRLDHVFLYYENDNKEHYRYRLAIVDRSLLPTTRLEYATAVVLIPAGRESEYVFSSQRGLISVAESANCARLVAVAFGRHYQFASQAAVQEELTYVVQVLGQQGRFLPPAQYKRYNATIPFMALDGVGSRNVLAEGETTLSGTYLVEKVKAENRLVRRLYFMENPFVIQSEVGMNDGKDAIDKTYLAFDYHKNMAAGILALTTSPDAAAAGMVIGLGGGGLVNFLQRVLPSSQLTVVELDESVVTIAETYFGFDSSGENMAVRVGNGLSVQCEPFDSRDSDGEGDTTPILFPPQSLDFIAIDVDSKDKTVGMSCPPVAFVEVPYLSRLKSLLRQGGVLVVNVSARDPSVLESVKQNMRDVFESVHVSHAQDDEDREDVNLVLFARKGEATLPLRVELVQNMRNSSLTMMPDASSTWQTTMSELEDSLAGMVAIIDGEEMPQIPKSKKKGGGKRKKGKRK